MSGRQPGLLPSVSICYTVMTLVAAARGRVQIFAFYFSLSALFLSLEECYLHLSGHLMKAFIIHRRYVNFVFLLSIHLMPNAH